MGRYLSMGDIEDFKKALKEKRKQAAQEGSESPTPPVIGMTFCCNICMMASVTWHNFSYV